jgi:nucleotide-binding universal stress UspA family protein
MLTQILVPLDGSPLADRALPYAVALGRATGARLTLLHVTATSEAEEAAAALDARAEQVRAGGVIVDARVYLIADGQVADAILRVAREDAADLIVMSTHGRSGIGRWIYGSVADRVLGLAQTPVLLVPAGCTHTWPTDRPLRVLVPLDGSALADEALHWAVALADVLKADLHLLQAVEPPTYLTTEGVMLSDPEPLLAEARRYLEGVAETLRRPERRVSFEAVSGWPAQEIAAVARQAGVDLIVMATHGRTGLARLVLGSVATGTVQRATVPVLLVRPVALRRPAPDLAAGEPLSAGPGRPAQRLTLVLTPAERDLLVRALRELWFALEEDERAERQARALLARLEALAASERA